MHIRVELDWHHWHLGREPRCWLDRAAWIVYLGPLTLWWDRGEQDAG